LGGLGALFGGLSSPKPPGGNGTAGRCLAREEVLISVVIP